MFRIFLLGFLLCSVINTTEAQKSVNDYKYVIVPNAYSFSKGTDTYQLNSLTKFLLDKYGFKAFLQDENFPEDLRANGCNALRADVKKESSVFVTKLILDLKDCNGKVVFTSAQGKSREKEYKTAYHQALRGAFVSVQELNYKYSGFNSEEAKVVENKPINKKETPVGLQGTEKTQNVLVVSGDSIVYLLNDEEYIFEKKDYGYEVFKNKNEKVSVGKAYVSSNQKSYIIQAGDLSGHGFFDGFGNFILERINPVTNKLIKDILARQ